MSSINLNISETSLTSNNAVASLKRQIESYPGTFNATDHPIKILFNGSETDTQQSTVVIDDLSQQPEYPVFFDFVVLGILLNVVGIMGLIGNTLTIAVLSRPQMRQSINCILIGLASFDIILIVTSILMFGLPSVYGFLSHYSQS